MRFTPSILTSLLKPIDRRAFKASVERHAANAYDKTLKSWHHLVVLVYAQLSGAASLRAIETGFNAQANHHYHLGCGRIARSTLGDANARRPPAVFTDLLGGLVTGLGRKSRQEAKQTLRLIDSTPIPLSDLFDCAASNGRIHGLKLHVLHDPERDCPIETDITPANVNDVGFGRGLTIEEGVTYVFDKAYCHFGWWTAIDQNKAFFVTRPKANTRFQTVFTADLDPEATRGDGFTVLADARVRLASRGDSRLPILLRRITVHRDNGDVFTLITNDRSRDARTIAACYKARWQIELFFRWVKQTLNLKKFIAFNENAVRLQILTAMIAHVLIVIARKTNAVALPPRRFAELARAFIHARRPIARIDKPTPGNPETRWPSHPDQLALAIP